MHGIAQQQQQGGSFSLLLMMIFIVFCDSISLILGLYNQLYVLWMILDVEWQSHVSLSLSLYV